MLKVLAWLTPLLPGALHRSPVLGSRGLHVAPGQDWLGGLQGAARGSRAGLARWARGAALLPASKLRGQSEAAEHEGGAQPTSHGVLGRHALGGPQWMGLGPQRGLMEPQVAVDPHSQPIPETEETTRGVGPGPPSWGRGAWSSLQKVTPLTRGHWTRPSHSARLSSWAAAGRPGCLVGRAGGHRHHTHLAALF